MIYDVVKYEVVVVLISIYIYKRHVFKPFMK